MSRDWWSRQPALAVCGWKNSGKTTLVERAVLHLRSRSLKVGVVKHDVHGLEVDKVGSDSDRMFRAGAEVVLQGPEETLHRCRQNRTRKLELSVRDLLLRNDVVLVEGHKRTQLPKVWLASPKSSTPPEGLANLLEVMPWSEDRVPRFLDCLDRWLEKAWRSKPRMGGVLIGGRSSRMGGHPKQLLRFGDRSLLEIAVRALEPHVDQVVLLGSGEVPASLRRLVQLADVPGVQGPLAGLLAALRWSPDTVWCISACDLPMANPEAMAWVLSQRLPGRWALLPRTSPSVIEPLFAAYEPQARELLDQLAGGESFGIQQLQSEGPVACPSPPDHLLSSWTSVNTREEFSKLSRTA